MKMKWFNVTMTGLLSTVWSISLSISSLSLSRFLSVSVCDGLVVSRSNTEHNHLKWRKSLDRKVKARATIVEYIQKHENLHCRHLYRVNSIFMKLQIRKVSQIWWNVSVVFILLYVYLWIYSLSAQHNNNVTYFQCGDAHTRPRIRIHSVPSYDE